MSKAKAIYKWWRGLSIWIRVPLSIVLVIALLALVIEGSVWFMRPRGKLVPYPPMDQAQSEQLERSAEKLKSAVEKADERYAEIKERIDNENETTRDFESKVRHADDFDTVDSILAKHREFREQRDRDRRRAERDEGED